MNNVSAQTTRPRRRRAPAIFAASVAAAGVAAFAPGANGATVVQPPNQAFAADAANWSATDSCVLLNGLLDGGGLLTDLLGGLAALGITCSSEAGFTGADGNPAGALEFRVSGLVPDTVNLLQLLGRGEATFTSSDFTYQGGTPTTVAFNFDVKADLTNLLELSGLRLVASLERIDQPGVLPLGSYDFTGPTQFQTLGLELPATALVPEASYRIIMRVETIGDLSLLSTPQRLVLDNIRLTATTPNGSGGPGGPGGPGGGGTGDGAGGLGACTTNIVEPAPARQNSKRGVIALSRTQLLTNQRISQAGVRRVNSVLDQFQSGLTSRDFQDCTIGSQKFAPALTEAIDAGRPAAPALPEQVQGARPVPQRVTKPGNPQDVALSREQLIINQRISQAAVRRVNAIAGRMNGGITAGDFRNGSLEAVTLNSDGRSTFANALPGAGQLSSSFVRFDIARKPGQGNAQFTLSRQQLLINQRISQAAVRRINAIRAQLAVGLSGQNVRNGSLSRSTLAPSIQLGRR